VESRRLREDIIVSLKYYNDEQKSFVLAVGGGAADGV
jgi:hypothetical protein